MSKHYTLLSESVKSPAHYWVALENLTTLTPSEEQSQLFRNYIHNEFEYLMFPYFGDGRLADVKKMNKQWSETNNPNNLPTIKEEDYRVLDNMKLALTNYTNLNELKVVKTEEFTYQKFVVPSFTLLKDNDNNYFYHTTISTMLDPEHYSKTLKNNGMEFQLGLIQMALENNELEFNEIKLVVVERNKPHSITMWTFKDDELLAKTTKQIKAIAKIVKNDDHSIPEVLTHDFAN